MVGDLNLHVDYEYCPHNIRLQSILKANGLDHVRQRTHTKGHQLHVFLTRSEQTICSIAVDPPSLYSDHSLITVDLEAANVGAVRQMKYVNRHRRRTFDIDQFAADVRSSRLVLDPPMDVNGLFACCDIS
jgi:hypothetical protein